MDDRINKLRQSLDTVDPSDVGTIAQIEQTALHLRGEVDAVLVRVHQLKEKQPDAGLDETTVTTIARKMLASSGVQWYFTLYNEMEHRTSFGIVRLAKAMVAEPGKEWTVDNAGNCQKDCNPADVIRVLQKVVELQESEHNYKVRERGDEYLATIYWDGRRR